MADNIKVDVTPNLKKCLEHLKSAVDSLPPGELKENANGALEYISQTFDGVPQPEEGLRCPPYKLVIKD